MLEARILDLTAKQTQKVFAGKISHSHFPPRDNSAKYQLRIANQSIHPRYKNRSYF